MPTASDELREIIHSYFGTIENEEVIVQFLKSRGYTLTPKWMWIKPTPAHTISNEEYDCLLFLYEEWDYGDVVASADAT